MYIYIYIYISIYITGTRPVFDTDNDKIILKEYIDTLTKNYKIILDEYIKNKNIESDYILNQDEHKLNNGVWAWNSYILKGVYYIYTYTYTDIYICIYIYIYM
jgi:hypothetical protein